MSNQQTRRRLCLIATAALSTIAIGGLGSAARADNPASGNVPDGQPARVAAAVAPLDDTRFAVVQPSLPNLVRGKNVVSARRLAEGNYEVIFDRDVRGCAFVGTSGNAAGGNPVAAEIAVAQRGGNPNGVYVDTRDGEGFTADRSFHLVVVC